MAPCCIVAGLIKQLQSPCEFLPNNKFWNLRLWNLFSATGPFTSELLSFLHVNFLSESMLTIKIPWWRKLLFLLLSRLSLDHLLAPLTQSSFLLFITHCMVSTVSSRATFTIKNFVVFGILASWIITLSFLEKKNNTAWSFLSLKDLQFILY